MVRSSMVEQMPYTHKVTSSSLVGPTGNCDLAQLAEHYPDTVKVDGSIPSVTTELVRSSIGPEYPAFTRRVVSSSLTEPTNWMNSSMAERWLVKPWVESSNLSSSAGRFGRDGSIAPV